MRQKLSIPRRRRTQLCGYTLVELLVVVAIIAILASLTTVAVFAGIRAARKTTTNVTMQQVLIGVESYRTDYGYMPLPSPRTGSDIVYGETTPSNQLVIALHGNFSPWNSRPATSTIPNPRNQRYLTFSPDPDKLLNDYLVSAFINEQSEDRMLRIAVDGDFDGLVEVPDTRSGTGTRSSFDSGAWSKLDRPLDQKQWSVID